MFIVAGLGNPGVAYEKTRHNAGYQALDRLAAALSVRVTKRAFSALTGEGVFAGQKILLLKPETYMNLSGDSVQAAVHFYKIPPHNLIVLYDDVELPVGALRIRAGGGPGTHNGMRSVTACMGTEDFPRVRIGVGDRARGELADYVLGRPGGAEQTLLDEAFDAASEAVQLILSGRIDEAQARFNKRHIGAKGGDA